MKKNMWIVPGVVAALFMAGVAMSAAAAQLITTEALSKMLDDPDVVIVDVRSERDWEASDAKIKGAVREDPGNVSFWLSKYPTDKKLVFYCAWANEYTSARVAREVLKQGYTRVYVLKGGWKMWLDDQYAVEKK